MTLTLSDLVTVRAVPAETGRLARHLGYLYGESDERVILAATCAITALSAGSVCFDLDQAALLSFDADIPAGLGWPAPDEWVNALTVSPMVSTDLAARDRPLVLDGRAVYLTRYWAEQEQIVGWLVPRLVPTGQTPDVPDDGLAATGPPADPSQHQAVAMAARSGFSVVAGGPGTGKTTVAAQILAALQQSSPEPLRVILTAPTGRAAARLDQAVHENLHQFPTSAGEPSDRRYTSGTLHRILGVKPWGAVDHDAGHPLPADVIVVDEASMLSLHLVALLLDAIPGPTRLILLGDPDQLASVEAGAVLADIVANAGLVSVTRLTHTYRFSGDIADLADAIRRGAADEALAVLHRSSDQIEWIPADTDAPGFSPDQLTSLRDDVTRQGLAMIDASTRGDAPEAIRLLNSHRLLLAHRHGLSGVSHWTHAVRGWIARNRGALAAPWFAGLPILVTRNDDLLGVFNGDSGVIVAEGTDLRLALDDGVGTRLIAPDMISSWEPLYASTIHKAQGSQFDAVSLILPPATTALLTRELFYTAVTRAKTFLRIVASPEAITHAITSPALRASGLASRLASLGTRSGAHSADPYHRDTNR